MAKALPYRREFRRFLRAVTAPAPDASIIRDERDLPSHDENVAQLKRRLLSGIMDGDERKRRDLVNLCFENVEQPNTFARLGCNPGHLAVLVDASKAALEELVCAGIKTMNEFRRDDDRAA